MGRVILPKTVPHGGLVRSPLIYLAGPIRGADDWQMYAYNLLGGLLLGRFTAVIPNRYTGAHTLLRPESRLPGNEHRFERQTDWERHYMAQAALARKPGCLVFWLPCESTTNPRPRDQGPYAQDSYGELGEWRGRMMADKNPKRFRVVIGAEEGFPGLSQIKRNYEEALGRRYDFGFPTTLIETLKLAVHRARNA